MTLELAAIVIAPNRPQALLRKELLLEDAGRIGQRPGVLQALTVRVVSLVQNSLTSDFNGLIEDAPLLDSLKRRHIHGADADLDDLADPSAGGGPSQQVDSRSSTKILSRSLAR